MSIKARMQQKHDVETNWKKATAFSPLAGELIVYDADSAHTSARFKIGDGKTNVNDLPFVDAKNIVTFGEASSGTGRGESILSQTYQIGSLTLGPLDDLDFLTVDELDTTNKTIKFKIGNSGLLTPGTLYSVLERIIENGFNGGILEINNYYIPITDLSGSSTGTIIKTYYVTAILDPAYEMPTLSTGISPTNIFIGVAYGARSSAFGDKPLALGENSFVEGNLSRTTIAGDTAHAEGYLTSAEATSAHSEGSLTLASGAAAHAEGNNTIASGTYSHSEGNGTIASAAYSHAEGNTSVATESSAHAEGNHTQAIGESAHSEGNGTIASGLYSHSGGINTIASGNVAFAHGTGAQALGPYSAAFGNQTVATSGNSFVVGKFNEKVDSGANFVVGSGDNENSRADGLRVYADGSVTSPASTITKIEKRGNAAIPTVEWSKRKLVNQQTRAQATVTEDFDYDDDSVPCFYGVYGKPQEDGTYKETQGLIKGSISVVKHNIREKIEEELKNGIISSTEAEEYTRNLNDSIIPERYSSMVTDRHTVPIKDGNSTIPVGLHTWREDENGDIIEGSEKLWYGGAAPQGWVTWAVREGEILPLMHGSGTWNPYEETPTGFYTGLQQPNRSTTDLWAGSKNEYAVALGGSSRASGEYSFAGGSGSYARGANSFAFGDHVESWKPGGAAFGKYNQESSAYLFCVGNGSSSGRSNILDATDKEARYNGSEIANMNNLIQSGTTLPTDTANGPKFFVLIEE